ncbi:MAG: o-succinylbenzoate synthase [Salinivirgaceae bacterium]|nr:o-succinylbenzoate synthase [Salinivirgaceae bacterium]
MLKASFKKHIFKFNFPGGTSRGVLLEKVSYFLKIWNSEISEIVGLGEVSLIPNLSPETSEQIELLLNEFIQNPNDFVTTKELKNFPALKFGLETALLDLETGAKKILFPSEFTKGKVGIRINGLVWMGTKDEMLQRIKEKIESGFTCIKIKIGAVSFHDEIELLKFIRKSFSVSDIEIRVDANGAFAPAEALSKLEILSKLQLHSIEQPIKQGQWMEMKRLCANTPLPIALDEELIGIADTDKRIQLLETIKPQYIILKPSLIGGLKDSEEWSKLAIKRNIAWWVTSALEGNIGLNAIAQWTFANGSKMPQGLGTGQVFSNNITSPLEIKGEELYYNPQINWQNI